MDASRHQFPRFIFRLAYMASPCVCFIRVEFLSEPFRYFFVIDMAYGRSRGHGLHRPGLCQGDGSGPFPKSPVQVFSLVMGMEQQMGEHAGSIGNT